MWPSAPGSPPTEVAVAVQLADPVLVAENTDASVSSPESMIERGYDADTARHSVLRALLPVVRYPGEIWRHRYLLQNFFRRELLGRFRGSALGIVWVLVHPLFLFAIYYFVFGYVFGRPATGTAPSPAFALYLFSGVLAFTAFGEGLIRSCTCVVDNGNLVKKVAFPSELLPVPPILVGLTVYLVGALVCLTAGLIWGVLQPDWTVLLLPVVLLLQFLMTLGLGLFLANCHVFARDTSHLWGILQTAWMFLTPVFWYPHQIPGELGDSLRAAFQWNPAYPLIQAHRIVLGARDFTLGDGETSIAVSFGSLGSHLASCAVWAIALLALGYGVFMSRRHRYADLV